MTSSYDIPPKYKIYLGRVFFLRKYENIPASASKLAGETRKFVRTETFGDSCLVLDESNSKVKVTCLDGSFLWIPKYFLHKEITNRKINKPDYINKLVDKIIKNPVLTTNDVKEVTGLLKEYADCLKRLKRESKWWLLKYYLRSK